MTTDAHLDSIRVRDLDAQGWLFVIAAAGSFGLAVLEAVSVYRGGGALASVLLFGLFGLGCLYVAGHIAAPEVAGRCSHCEEKLAVNSGTDSHDVAVRVRFAGPPTRVGAGALSVVTARDTLTRTYCSAACARADLGPLHDQDQPSETVAEPVPVSRQVPIEGGD